MKTEIRRQQGKFGEKISVSVSVSESYSKKTTPLKSVGIGSPKPDSLSMIERPVDNMVSTT
jgi:hypothetical protein